MGNRARGVIGLKSNIVVPVDGLAFILLNWFRIGFIMTAEAVAPSRAPAGGKKGKPKSKCWE
jgi:hypothetical protein